MSNPLRAIVAGTGRAIPSEVLPNSFFEEYLDTSDEWITSRSGIKQRYRAGEGETTVTLAKEATLKALEDANLAATDLDMIIFATVTPDTPVPASACWLQREIGARQIPAMDINAACAGLAYAMVSAALFIEADSYRNVLVVGSETLSRITNYQDRSTCVIFGDGAAAIVMSRTTDANRGMLYHNLGADGRGAEFIIMPGGGSRIPATPKSAADSLHTLHMSGREVYKFAVQRFQGLVDKTLSETGHKPEDLAMIIPHQSNLRIINSVKERLGLPDEKMLVNIDRYGNTSSASIGLALDEGRRDGRIREGDLVMLLGFGAGLTWGSILMRM